MQSLHVSCRVPLLEDDIAVLDVSEIVHPIMKRVK
jgi:hypothetical protein